MLTADGPENLMMSYLAATVEDSCGTIAIELINPLVMLAEDDRCLPAGEAGLARGQGEDHGVSEEARGMMIMWPSSLV